VGYGLADGRHRVQPGESPAVFGDALPRLSDQAIRLYVDGTRLHPSPGTCWDSARESRSQAALPLLVDESD
jgi:hypothetical protein